MNKKKENSMVIINGANQVKVTHLTGAQLAERFHVHPGTPANWRTDGWGPKWIKPGKIVLYPIEEVEEFEKRIIQRTTFTH